MNISYYLLLLSLSHCSGCNTPKEQKTKEDKIPGIKKLITDIKQYMKNPPPSGSSSLSNIIDERFWMILFESIG